MVIIVIVDYVSVFYKQFILIYTLDTLMMLETYFNNSIEHIIVLL